MAVFERATGTPGYFWRCIAIDLAGMKLTRSAPKKTARCKPSGRFLLHQFSLALELDAAIDRDTHTAFAAGHILCRHAI